MKKLLNPQQKNQSLSLSELLVKIVSLDRLWKNTENVSRETRKNIEWYCDYKTERYYQRYKTSRHLIQLK